MIFKIFMILKASKMGFEKENHDFNWLRSLLHSSAVMVIIVAFGEGLFFGGGI